MNKENQKIIEALESSKRALPSEEFLSRMERMATSYIEESSSFSKMSILGIAASFLLLLTANFVTLNQYRNQPNIAELENTSQEYIMVPSKSIYHE